MGKEKQELHEMLKRRDNPELIPIASIWRILKILLRNVMEH